MDHRLYETEVEIKTMNPKAYSLSDTNKTDKCNNTVSQIVLKEKNSLTVTNVPVCSSEINFVLVMIL